MNSASTHIYRLTSIRSVSIRSYKAERLHFIFEKNMKESRKKKKTTLALPPSRIACGLWSSRTVHVFRRSPSTQLLRVNPKALTRAGGASVWGGQERNQRQRGGGWSTNPQTSLLRQSPKAVLMEVSTEDGADISGKPKCIQHRQQV